MKLKIIIINHVVHVNWHNLMHTAQHNISNTKIDLIKTTINAHTHTHICTFEKLCTKWRVGVLFWFQLQPFQRRKGSLNFLELVVWGSAQTLRDFHSILLTELFNVTQNEMQPVAKRKKLFLNESNECKASSSLF